MGWGNTGNSEQGHSQGGHRADGNSIWPPFGMSAAAAVFAGQLPVAWLVWWIGEQGGDDHGRGFNSLGMFCMLIFVPLVLPVLGLLLAIVHTLPTDILARFVAARARGPRWAWQVACSVLVGVGWAALTAVLWDWSLTDTVPLFAALGVLPALGMPYMERRQWGTWAVWFRAGLASLALFVVVGTGGVVAASTGLLPEYEPPVLYSGQLTGVWHGPEGAVLRLHPGGRAEFAELPAETEIDDWSDGQYWAVCDGTGTWSLTRENPGGWVEHRDGIALTLDGGCGQDTYWTIGGSEREPELFVLFGDPDAGELWILERAS